MSEPRLFHGAGNGRDRGKVQDRVRLGLARRGQERGEISNVADQELRVALQAIEVRPFARGQVIPNRHVVARATSAATVCEPMNPAPPVTKIRIIASTSK